MNIYYVTVKFTGSPYVPPVNDTSAPVDAATDNNTFVPSPINFNITAIDWKSKGQLQFSQAVNMSNVVANWSNLFTVYVDCRTRNITEEVLAFDITSNSQNIYLNFTVTFKFPYLLGLLNKKKDYLVIALQNNTDPG